jgi:hypothetical protein
MVQQTRYRGVRSWMPLSRACLHHHLRYLTPCELRWPLIPKWCCYRISWQRVQLRRDGPKLICCCCSGGKFSSQMLQACGHTCWPMHTRQDMRASRKLYTGDGPPSIVHKPISAYGSSCWAVLYVSATNLNISTRRVCYILFQSHLLFGVISLWILWRVFRR